MADGTVGLFRRHGGRLARISAADPGAPRRLGPVRLVVTAAAGIAALWADGERVFTLRSEAALAGGAGIAASGPGRFTFAGFELDPAARRRVEAAAE